MLGELLVPPWWGSDRSLVGACWPWVFDVIEASGIKPQASNTAGPILLRADFRVPVVDVVGVSGPSNNVNSHWRTTTTHLAAIRYSATLSDLREPTTSIGATRAHSRSVASHAIQPPATVSPTRRRSLGRPSKIRTYLIDITATAPRAHSVFPAFPKKSASPIPPPPRIHDRANERVSPRRRAVRDDSVASTRSIADATAPPAFVWPVATWIEATPIEREPASTRESRE